MNTEALLKLMVEISGGEVTEQDMIIFAAERQAIDMFDGGMDIQDVAYMILNGVKAMDVEGTQDWLDNMQTMFEHEAVDEITNHLKEWFKKE